MKNFVIILFFIGTLLAQDLNKWEIHSSLNNTIDLIKIEDGYWCLSNSGIYHYNINNDEFNIINKGDGLSGSSFSAMAIDESGRIWIGSRNGKINIYNSETGLVKIIPDIFNSDFTRKGINQIIIKNNKAYLSADYGISIINTETLLFEDTYRKFGDYPAESSVNKISFNNKLIACTENGIAILKENATNPAAPESWETINSPSSNLISVFESDNNIYTANSNKIYKYENGSWVEIYNGSDIVDFKVIDTDLIIVSSKSIVFFNGNASETLFNYNSNFLTSIIFESKSNFSIGSEDGFIIFATDNEKYISPPTPESNNFFDVDINSNGEIFVATGKNNNGKGVYKYNGSEWITYNISNTPEFLTNDFHKVKVIDNEEYFLSWGKGFSSKINENFTTYFSDNTPLAGIPSSSNSFIIVNGIEKDRNNNLWVLNYWSENYTPLLMLSNDNQWYEFSYPTFLKSDEGISQLIIDQYNTKWFTGVVNNNYVYYFNENNTPTDKSDDVWGTISTSNGLLSGTIRDIEIDNRGEIWIATDKGINIISQPAQPTQSITRGLGAIFGKNVEHIAVDPLNRKWIVTGESVFLVSQDGTQLIEEYTTENSPLPSNIINDVEIDGNNGIVYFATDLGLAALKTNAIKPAESFEELIVYPNPFIIPQHTEIKIDGLIKDSEIKIFSVNGSLISEIQTEGGRMATWNGKDLSGNYVASGIYIIVATDSDATEVTYSKIAVLRK